MGLFSRLASFIRPPTVEQQTRVTVDDIGVTCIRPEGRIDAVKWSDLQSVAIETNACGPFIEDVYFHFEGPEYRFFIPQGAAGSDGLVDLLLKLPGFNTAAFSAAMSCTIEARFDCWKRSHAQT